MSVTREKEQKTYRWLTIVFTCGEPYCGMQTPQNKGKCTKCLSNIKVLRSTRSKESNFEVGCPRHSLKKLDFDIWAQKTTLC